VRHHRATVFCAALLLAALFLAPGAYAQAVLQGGPVQSGGGHVPMYIAGPGMAQSTLVDSGPAGNFTQGQGISEMLQVNRGLTAGQTQPAGSGPYGTHNCGYDQPNLTNGAHFLCWDANAGGNATIAVGAIGSALPVGLNFIINGVTYGFPGPGGGNVTGPNTGTSVNYAPLWNSSPQGTALQPGVPKGQISANAGAIVSRMGDRLFVGKNTNVNDGNNPSTTKDWLETIFPNTTALATVAALGQFGGIGTLGGVRTSDGAPSGYASAATGFCINDNTISGGGSPTACASGYFESQHPVGAYGSNWTHGIEIDIDEMNSGTVNGVTFPVLSHPFSSNPSGMTTGMIIASGGLRTGAQPATTALRITPNGALFQTGIEIRNGALAVGVGGFSEAMALPASYILQWYGSDNSPNSYLGSTAGPGSATTGVVLSNGGITVISSAAAALTLQNTGSNTAEIFYKNASTTKFVSGINSSNQFLIHDQGTGVDALNISSGNITLGEGASGTLALIVTNGGSAAKYVCVDASNIVVIQAGAC
jgi:hypothetical protein